LGRSGKPHPRAKSRDALVFGEDLIVDAFVIPVARSAGRNPWDDVRGFGPWVPGSSLRDAPE
ncbi:MAG TPA: hypothetical protein PLK37_16165, partial [Terricaulis sp.]|nr:hypothetical protein [Terricaulis sp.]